MVTQTAAASEKRLAILNSAVDTFARQGFRNADVQKIADAAGVGKGTVYRYLGRKEDLFWACVYHVLEQLEQHMEASMQELTAPLPMLRSACHAYAVFFEANPKYLEICVQERAEFRGSAPENHLAFHEELIERFGQILQQGIEQGEVRPVNVRETIVSLGSLLYGSVIWGCYANDDRTPTERAACAVDVFLQGLRREES